MGIKRTAPFLCHKNFHHLGIRREGFSLLELLITMALLGILIIITSYTFPFIFKSSRKEAGVVHSQVESIIGLQILTKDIEQAGFGLPLFFKESINYAEAVEEPQSYYNDAPFPPRPILSGNNINYDGYINGSDYLVVKSTICAENSAGKAFGYITKEGLKSFENSEESLEKNYRVIVVKPETEGEKLKELISVNGNFFGVYPNLSSFYPSLSNETYIVYGVDPDTDLRMPFNRADFYVRRPQEMPEGCAEATGILYKAQIRQKDGKRLEMPLVECVADMQVFFGIDQNGDGSIDGYMEDIGGFDAFFISQRVKEVKIFILAHEAGKDKGYTHKERVIKVGEGSFGRDFDLQEKIGEEWQHYRWRLYKISVRLRNLL